MSVERCAKCGGKGFRPGTTDDCPSFDVIPGRIPCDCEAGKRVRLSAKEYLERPELWQPIDIDELKRKYGAGA